MDAVQTHALDAALLRANLLLVDDDEQLLDLTKQWLTLSGYAVKTATNGIQAIQQLREQDFDLVVIDLHLPDIYGLQLLTILKELRPSIEVIILSGQGTMDDAIQALRGGRAFDFLRKPLVDLNELNHTIYAALKKQREALGTTAPPPPDPSRREGEALTDREVAILSLVADGLDNREIGKRLILSDKTVRNHLSRIYLKLKVANRAQAVSHAQKQGYL